MPVSQSACKINCIRAQFIDGKIAVEAALPVNEYPDPIRQEQMSSKPATTKQPTRQPVRVERVNVESGGQAIVGDLSHAGSVKSEK